MSDKDPMEVLELAAKAAGFVGECVMTSLGPIIRYEDEFHVSDFMPLIDDGDALRLAVKLCIQIPVIGGGMFSDPLAETRLRIVRAAAEIGKAMA